MSRKSYQTNGKLTYLNRSLSPMQWVFLGLMTLWGFIALISIVLLFWYTKNTLCFTLFTTIAPPVYVWWRITHYLFPKDDRDYEVELEKIRRGYGIPLFKPSNKSQSKIDNL